VADSDKLHIPFLHICAIFFSIFTLDIYEQYSMEIRHVWTWQELCRADFLGLGSLQFGSGFFRIFSRKGKSEMIQFYQLDMEKGTN
jgi:hypothetical protein